MIVIQHIQTQWSKLSRGLRAAQQRQSVAPAFVLPDIHKLEEQQATILRHHVVAYEHSSFIPEQHIDYIDTSHYWTFDFQQHDDALTIYFKEDAYYHGQPHHAGQRQLLCQLKHKQIATLKINGRFTLEEGHIYQQHIVNLAWVQQVDSNLFISGKPLIEIDKIVDLF